MMSVPELRKLCSERGIYPPVRASLVSARKADLLAALRDGKWPETGETTPAPSGGSADAVELMRQAMALIASAAKPGVDEDTVRAIVADEVAKLPARELRVQVADLPEVKLATQHSHFPLLLLAVANGVNTMMVGPAGSGKTSAARHVAEAMGLPFACLSVNPQTSKSDLLGGRTATGYVPSLFVTTYRDGGVFLLDEIDAGNPGVLTTLNAAAAGDVLATPEGMVRKHDNFRLIAAANTFGTGASRQYVGRQQLDAATLDRFWMLEWPVDWAMCAASRGVKLPGVAVNVEQGGTYTPQEWADKVAKVAAAIEAEKVRTVVSPRALFAGLTLSGVGMGRHWVDEGLLWRGMDADTRKRVEARLS